MYDTGPGEEASGIVRAQVVILYLSDLMVCCLLFTHRNKGDKLCFNKLKQRYLAEENSPYPRDTQISSNDTLHAHARPCRPRLPICNQL